MRVFGKIVVVGMRRWKAYNLGPILAAHCAELAFCRTTHGAARRALGRDDAIAVWGAVPPPGIEALVAQTGAELLRIEDGFVRSVGLGSDLIAPQSLVIDDTGIYFDATRPSRLETILQAVDFDAALLARAKAVRRTIVDHGLTKYNLEERQAPRWQSGGRRVVLVPGQVESDASIALGGTSVRSNLGLLEQVRAVCPDACIVYKPHPDVMSGNRRGRRAEHKAMDIADIVETRCSIVSCIDASDEVHTITSLAGFDALLRGKPVTTWGMPFYAGWGVTTDRAPLPAAASRRTQSLSVDQIVAGALLRYPLYWDEALARPTNCESVLSNIAQQRNLLERGAKLDELRKGGMARLSRKLRTLGRAWLGTRSRDRWWN